MKMLSLPPFLTPFWFGRKASSSISPSSTSSSWRSAILNVARSSRFSRATDRSRWSDIEALVAASAMRMKITSKDHDGADASGHPLFFVILIRSSEGGVLESVREETRVKCFSEDMAG
jgi:hypothetical protein